MNTNTLKKTVPMLLSMIVMVSFLGCSKVEKVKINDREIELSVGDRYSIDYDIEPKSEKKNAEWESSDEDVATVNSSGKITAVDSGECEITLTVGNMSDTVTVTVVVTSGPDFQSLYAEYCDSSFATVASDNSYLNLIVYEFDYRNHPERVTALQQINSSLGLPQSVLNGMESVRPIDGRISESYGDITVTYAFTGDYLDVTYSYNG